MHPNQVNSTIKNIAKTLGVAKSTIWYIIKRKEGTDELRNTKRPERPHKATCFLHSSYGEEKLFMTVAKVKSTLQEVGMSVAKYIIKKRLQQRWLTPVDDL